MTKKCCHKIIDPISDFDVINGRPLIFFDVDNAKVESYFRRWQNNFLQKINENFSLALWYCNLDFVLRVIEVNTIDDSELKDNTSMYV